MTAYNLATFPATIFSTTSHVGPLVNFVVTGNVSALAPVLNNNSPTVGSTVANISTLGFDVTVADNSGLGFVIVWVYYRDLHYAEVVYDGTAFLENFSGTVSAITNGLRFSFRKLSGWNSTEIDIKARAVSSRGGLS